MGITEHKKEGENKPLGIKQCTKEFLKSQKRILGETWQQNFQKIREKNNFLERKHIQNGSQRLQKAWITPQYKKLVQSMTPESPGDTAFYKWI